ncbi:MAG: sugar transferase [Clostridia bacterium]|nr:sugar transferase [Clostridia bacterium]
MEVLIKFRKSIMLFIKVLIILALIFTFVGVWRGFYVYSLFSSFANNLIVLSYFVLLITFIVLYGGFRIGINRLHEIIYSQSLALFFTNFIIYLELSLLSRRAVAILPMVLSLVLQIAVCFIGAYCANTIYFRLYSARKMIAVFTDESSSGKLIKKISKIPERFQVSRGVSLLRYSVQEIKEIIDGYDAVLICDIDKTIKYDILAYCYAKMKRVYVLPSSTEIIIGNSYHIQISDTPVLMCRNRGLTIEQRAIKRFIDIVFSLLGIIVSSPIMFVIAVSIKICDGGPVLFKQNRITKNGKIFNVLKFRSMVVNADKDGAVKATENDNRITPVGKIIRPLRLDELPQLFNILFGSMSFVGPRPERIENVYEYTNRFPDFDLRHRVKGGLTGYAQIYGKYNTTPEDKLKMDLIYIERYSLFLDIKLVMMTIKILFMRESTEGFDDKDNKNARKSNSLKEIEE